MPHHSRRAPLVDVVRLIPRAATLERTEAKVRNVLIVDDHPIVREGLRRLIDLAPDLSVCGAAQSEREARAAIRECMPDVMIVDISLGQGDGFELVRDVHAHYPNLPMLVLSMHDEVIYAERMLAAGARGYVMKQTAPDQLLVALRRVLAGGIYLGAALAASLSGAAGASTVGVGHDPIGRLSNRELQVLSLIGRGQSSRVAAQALGLSVKTVETHRQALKRKLNLATNGQLLQYAINWFTERSRSPAA
jgi:DNA-binding NarL/FixJ family response regulator